MACDHLSGKLNTRCVQKVSMLKLYLSLAEINTEWNVIFSQNSPIAFNGYSIVWRVSFMPFGQIFCLVNKKKKNEEC